MSVLKWYRSWPSVNEFAEGDLEAKRDYVHDHLPKIILDKRGYQTVGEHNSLGTANGTILQGWPEEEPGFCMLEWDVALDPWSRAAFAAEALVEPRSVLVAPYRLYDTWCMWRGNSGFGPDSKTGRPVQVGDTDCNSFGLGCIYLPKIVLQEFLEQRTGNFSDGDFGGWYYDRYGPARCTWRVHPQHLHEYGLAGVPIA